MDSASLSRGTLTELTQKKKATPEKAWPFSETF